MFKILNSPNEAISRYQMQKEVSKVTAREILKEKSMGKMSESSLGIKVEPLKYAMWSKGKGESKGNPYLKDYERTLPEKLSPQTQNEMWKRAKQLKDEFTLGMLSRAELHPTKSFTENGTTKHVVDEERMRLLNSTEREHAWNKKNDIKIKEFKNIMRHLNPEDPNAGDIEKYRPKDRRN